MLQTAERSLSTIVSLRTNLEVNYTLHVDRRNNGNEGGKGRLKGTRGDVARGERKRRTPAETEQEKERPMAQLPSLLVHSGLPHHPRRGADRRARHERVQATGAKRAQFWHVLPLQARNVITALLACGRHCLPEENRTGWWYAEEEEEEEPHVTWREHAQLMHTPPMCAPFSFLPPRDARATHRARR